MPDEERGQWGVSVDRFDTSDNDTMHAQRPRLSIVIGDTAWNDLVKLSIIGVIGNDLLKRWEFAN